MVPWGSHRFLSQFYPFLHVHLCKYNVINFLKREYLIFVMTFDAQTNIMNPYCEVFQNCKYFYLSTLGWSINRNGTNRFKPVKP